MKKKITRSEHLKFLSVFGTFLCTCIIGSYMVYSEAKKVVATTLPIEYEYVSIKIKSARQAYYMLFKFKNTSILAEVSIAPGECDAIASGDFPLIYFSSKIGVFTLHNLSTYRTQHIIMLSILIVAILPLFFMRRNASHEVTTFSSKPNDMPEKKKKDFKQLE